MISRMSSSGTDVPMWSGEESEHVGAGGELRGEHDPDADRDPRGRLPAGRRPLGHQRGEQQHERVGHRRGDVHDALARARAPARSSAYCGTSVVKNVDVRQSSSRAAAGCRGACPTPCQRCRGAVRVHRAGTGQPQVDGEGGRRPPPSTRRRPAAAGPDRGRPRPARAVGVSRADGGRSQAVAAASVMPVDRGNQNHQTNSPALFHHDDSHREAMRAGRVKATVRSR